MSTTDQLPPAGTHVSYTPGPKGRPRPTIRIIVPGKGQPQAQRPPFHKHTSKGKGKPHHRFFNGVGKAIENEKHIGTRKKE